MSAPNWPSELQDTVDGDSFDYKFGETVVRSEMDIGPQKMRRRFTRGINSVGVTIMVDQDQFAILKTFYNTTTNAGITAFSLAHPVTGSSALWKFLSPPTFKHIGGGNFRVTMSWEEQV